MNLKTTTQSDDSVDDNWSHAVVPQSQSGYLINLYELHGIRGHGEKLRLLSCPAPGCTEEWTEDINSNGRNELAGHLDDAHGPEDFGMGPTNPADSLSNPKKVADGGVRWTNLTGFQRDMLLEIYQLEKPKGLEVKSALEHTLGEKVNHGRLYPNLDELVSHGLVEKGKIDHRSNYYQITRSGRALVEEIAQVFASATSRAATDGGRDDRF